MPYPQVCSIGLFFLQVKEQLLAEDDLLIHNVLETTENLREQTAAIINTFKHPEKEDFGTRVLGDTCGVMYETVEAVLHGNKIISCKMQRTNFFSQRNS